MAESWKWNRDVSEMNVMLCLFSRSSWNQELAQELHHPDYLMEPLLKDLWPRLVPADLKCQWAVWTGQRVSALQPEALRGWHHQTHQGRNQQSMIKVGCSKVCQTQHLSAPFLHQPGKKCLNIYREELPSNFTISGCTSKKLYRPKYCGVCKDERCCIPYKSKTIDVEFECPNGTGFTWKMMWIQACFCNLSCKNPNDIFADLESYYGFPEIMN